MRRGGPWLSKVTDPLFGGPKKYVPLKPWVVGRLKSDHTGTCYLFWGMKVTILWFLSFKKGGAVGCSLGYGCFDPYAYVG